MKYYIASLLAFTDVQDPSETTPLFLSLSIPALFPADSMRHAGELAREQLFERWKPEEGWHTHQANILPVSQEVYDSWVALSKAHALEVDDGPGETFNF